MEFLELLVIIVLPVYIELLVALVLLVFMCIRPSRPGSEDAAFTSKKSERTNKGENGGLHQFGPNRIKNSKTCVLLISDYKVHNILANE